MNHRFQRISLKCYLRWFGFLRESSFSSKNRLEIEAVQDFLIKLDMKPCMRQVEISIFSVDHVIFRLTKIMNSLLEHLKIPTIKVIVCVLNWLNLSKIKIYEKYLTR